MEPISVTAGVALGALARSGLIARLLGPSADAVGEALGEVTERRLRNITRIVEKAEPKIGPSDGEVNLRVAHRILEEGSYCEDEMMAEYLSGVLAGSRSSDPADDRAVAWCALVTNMSSLEIRAHFLLYSTWAVALRGAEVDLWGHEGRTRSRLYCDEIEFWTTLTMTTNADLESSRLAHALNGLGRRDLIGPDAGWGPRGHVVHKDGPFEYTVAVTPSLTGIELYGWALGIVGLTANDLLELEREISPDLPRLMNWAVPALGVSSSGT